MPQDRLTPLGRHLRTVLANLCRSTRTYSTSNPQTPVSVERHAPTTKHHVPGRSQQDAVRHLHTSVTARSAMPAVAGGVEKRAPSTSPDFRSAKRLRKHGWRRLNRRTHVAHTTLALFSVGKGHLIHGRPGRNITHVNMMSRHRWQVYGENRMRHAQDVIPDPAVSQELSLPRILAKCIRDIATTKDPSASDVTHGLTSHEMDYIAGEGFNVQDVSAWAHIVSTDGSLDCAYMISERIKSRGPCAIPAFVYMQILRRPHISAQALRIILQHFSMSFDVKLSSTATPGPYLPSLFQAVVRLIRHARLVWTPAFPHIVDLFIRHLERTHQARQTTDPRRIMWSLAVATQWLNKIMSLISVSSAKLPFKDNVFQEEAIVRILRFMACHDPPLHPNRDGYRAVVRLQLAQPKSEDDRLWAELKALSWPPWKMSRTAMDDAIGPEQGISKANQTLRQMQSAGYALLEWEKAIQAYTGWDADGTPTIQTRALVPRGVPSYSQVSAKWLARIASTRTVQEAWACYLAWEDSGLPSDENVYLAIFEKLLEEEKRQRMENSGRQDGYERSTVPLLPGDGREIAPLPPSTHLYTYTRTPPPTVDDFYHQLRQRGTRFGGHLLAFVVANASSLDTGMRRLEDALPDYPEIQGILSFDTSRDFSMIPAELFTAAIKLFYRFARVRPSGSRIASDVRRANKSLARVLPNDHRLNRNHLAVRALELLSSRQTCPCPAWHAALKGLTREENFHGLWAASATKFSSSKPGQSRNIDSALMKILDKDASALLAYRLFWFTVRLHREQHMELDGGDFLYLCRATENLVVAAWAILQTDRDSPLESLNVHEDVLSHYLSEVKQTLHGNDHEKRLKNEFQTIHEGDRTLEIMTQPDSFDVASQRFPSLLAVPNPAQLHAYARALGWSADYDGLSSFVKWMRKHRGELAERMHRDRSGEGMMRRTLVAIRAFLERSWLSTPDGEQSDSVTTTSDVVEASVGATAGQSILERFRTPAASETIRDIRNVIDSVEDWKGWPSEQEVEEYCQDARFDRVR